jgi:hypothetical protein
VSDLNKELAMATIEETEAIAVKIAIEKLRRRDEPQTTYVAFDRVVKRGAHLKPARAICDTPVESIRRADEQVTAAHTDPDLR